MIRSFWHLQPVMSLSGKTPQDAWFRRPVHLDPAGKGSHSAETLERVGWLSGTSHARINRNLVSRGNTRGWENSSVVTNKNGPIPQLARNHHWEWADAHAKVPTSSLDLLAAAAANQDSAAAVQKAWTRCLSCVQLSAQCLIRRYCLQHTMHYAPLYYSSNKGNAWKLARPAQPCTGPLAALPVELGGRTGRVHKARVRTGRPAQPGPCLAACRMCCCSRRWDILLDCVLQAFSFDSTAR